jgi:putative ABC transport system permease protein
MFWRMLIRAAMLRKGRAAAALLAMIVAAAVATAMLNLYADVQAKLRKEFRNYGANVIVTSRDGQPLPPNTFQQIVGQMDGRGLAVPFSYVVARTSDGQPVVVAGTDFSAVQHLDSWWSVTSWPQEPGQALLGKRAAESISSKGQPFTLSFQGKTITLNPAGTVSSGSSEDSRIYLSQSNFESWTGLAASTIEVAAAGSPAEIDGTITRMRQAVPGVDVQPVRQIMEGEARVLGKTRLTLLTCCALIIFTAALCVFATLVGWVFDRRRDFAIMKALGASERLIGAFFAAEATLLGFVGAGLGFVLGIGIAMWIGRVNFNAPVVPRVSVFPAIAIGSVLVALVASALPMMLLRRVQPAMILRGE